MAACGNKQKDDAKEADFNDVSTWKAQGSLVAEVMKDIKAEPLGRMKNVVTKFGWTLDKATITAQRLKQHVGVYAGDAGTFNEMSDVFDEVINKYHNMNVNKNVAQEETYQEVKLPKLKGKKANAIVSTRIRTARNLKSLPFTVNMTKEQRLKLEEVSKKVFNTFTGPLSGKYHPMVGMKEEERKDLVDKHFLYINDDPTLELVGCYTDWPAGRGIWINEEKYHKHYGIFIVWVGEEDQWRIMAMNKGSGVQDVWDLFYSGVEAVHKAVRDMGDDFVFSKTHGYLSTCPTNIGTGMRASVHVDLPNFKSKEAAKKWVKSKKLMIDVRGTRGEATDTSDCTRYDVSNKARLGSDCVQQITTMVDGVKQMLAVEEVMK